MVSGADLRYGGEWFDILVAAFITLFVLIVFSLFSSGLVCIWALAGVIIVVAISTISNRAVMKSSTRVDEEAWPEVHRIMLTCSDRLNRRPPRLYISPSRSVNAYASGILDPIIVLHRGLVDIMDKDELAFVVGHELGHVKLLHTSLKTVFESGMTHVPFIIYLPLLLFRLLFLRGRMSRSMEHSADRAGLYACRDIGAAVSCMLKLHTGSASIDQDVIRKAIESGGKEFGQSGWQNILSTHPDKASRIRVLTEYSRTHGIGWPTDGPGNGN